MQISSFMTFIVIMKLITFIKKLFCTFRAGSRHEPQSELGAAHLLRSAAGLTTKNASAFITSRKLAQIGASFSASGDREFIYYTIEVSFIIILINL